MARVTRPSLTKRLVDALKPGDVVWDSDVSGFGVRCQKASKIFVLKYRINGRQRWMSIGRYGSPWTVITARLEAQRLLGELAGGTDVALFRDTARQSPTYPVRAKTEFAAHGLWIHQKRGQDPRRRGCIRR